MGKLCYQGRSSAVPNVLAYLVGTDVWQNTHMQMAVVSSTPESKDIVVVLLTNLKKQLFEASGDPIYQENLSTIARAEDQMIAYIGL